MRQQTREDSRFEETSKGIRADADRMRTTPMVSHRLRSIQGAQFTMWIEKLARPSLCEKRHDSDRKSPIIMTIDGWSIIFLLLDSRIYSFKNCKPPCVFWRKQSSIRSSGRHLTELREQGIYLVAILFIYYIIGRNHSEDFHRIQYSFSRLTCPWLITIFCQSNLNVPFS